MLAAYGEGSMNPASQSSSTVDEALSHQPIFYETVKSSHALLQR
jgi:hypothetical protein